MSTSPKSPTKHLITTAAAASSVSPTTKSNTKLNNLINLPPTTNSDSEMHNEKQQQQNCKRIKLSDSVDDLSNTTNGIEQQEDQKILVHKTPKVKTIKFFIFFLNNLHTNL